MQNVTGLKTSHLFIYFIKQTSKFLAEISFFSQEPYLILANVWFLPLLSKGYIALA